MRSNYRKPALLAGALAITAIFAGPAFAADTDLVQRCEALATRFMTADVSHMSAEKLESARRQANLGQRLCKSEPNVGVKAIVIALRDIGDTAI
jgi:hypothetical protein